MLSKLGHREWKVGKWGVFQTDGDGFIKIVCRNDLHTDEVYKKVSSFSK